MNSPGLEHLSLIEGAMRRQQLRSERQRVNVFILLLLFLIIVVAALRMLPGLVREDLRTLLSSTFVPIASVVGVFLCYEVWVAWWLHRRSQHDKPLPRQFHYLNALIETSFPSAALIVGAQAMGGLPMLAGVVPTVYFLLLGLTALSLDPRLCLFAGVVACTEFLTISLILLKLDPSSSIVTSAEVAQLHSPHQYVIKSLLLLAGGCIAGFVAAQIRHQLHSALRTVQERDRAVSIFGQHVSPQVAEMLLHQPMSGSGEERQVCVMFLDIRDFSRIAGERSPTEVMDYLNTLFGFMIPVINDHRGIINKFLGDGFMAVFGAPVHDDSVCRHAVEAARLILHRVDEMNATQTIPPTRLGIGLHLGVALTGNVGGGDRKEYTVIGDAVNLAARIEQATKPFQAQLLVSEQVAHALPDIEAEDLGMVELKGQAKAVRLFKIV